MKITEKAIIIGLVSFIVFAVGNIFLGSIIGVIIPGGDDYINSYYFPLYGGITFLISLVISCTYMLVKKINILINEIKELKEMK